MRAFKTINVGDQDLQRVQENTDNAFRQFLRNALLDSAFLETIDLVTGQDNVINHTLNRPLRGWFPVRKSAEATLWDTQAINTLPSRTLVLQTSADVTISLIVF